MKRFYFSIAQWNSDFIFKPIRSRNDVIVLMMKVIKLMDVGPILTARPEGQHFELVVAQMSRLFFFSENKHYSIGFPFSVALEDGRVYFKTGSGVDVDSQMTSDILSVMSSSEVFEYDDILDFATPVSDFLFHNPGGWTVLRELLMQEDGYIRYDHDPAHANGNIHPLYHLDVFYSSGQTFKIGLTKKSDSNYLIDALDLQTACHYLSVVR